MMLGLCLTGCFQGKQGIPPITLEHARSMAADATIEPKTVVEQYNAVQSEFDGKDNETAGQALLEVAQFASDPARYVSAKQRKDLANDSNKREEVELEGLNTARQALKQLEQRYAVTKAHKASQDLNLLTAVEQNIDKHNSHTFQYKIVDYLVKLTGDKPGFSYWFALVLIAFFIKGVTFPLLLKTYSSQREMQKIQPILKEIQEKYKEDQVEMQSRIMAAYKEHGVNPFASCIPALIQMPIFIWMFQTVHAYEIHFANGHFLWINPATASSPIGKLLGIGTDLGHLDIPILVLYAFSMWVSMQLTPSPDPQMAAQQRQMSLFMICFMVYWFLSSKWSSAFLLYYLVQNILSTLQQYFFIYKPNRENAAKNPPGPITSLNSQKPEEATSKSSGKSAPIASSVISEESDRKDGRTVVTTANRPRPKRKPRR